MSLPAKSMQVLIDLQKKLLSRELPTTPVAAAAEAPEKPKRERKPTQVMRNARVRCPGWQRFCQRGGRW
jgi:hypothetical protein